MTTTIKASPSPARGEQIAVLEAVLKDAPNDSATNHYWVPVIEPSNHPVRAIPSAALDGLGGHPADTKSGYVAFLRAWPNADPVLGEVTHARTAIEPGGPAVATR